MTGPYQDVLVAFGTRHGKERQAAGPFAEVLGARVEAPPDLDTDRFGTFSGEVPRTLAPLDAARAKAALALPTDEPGVSLLACPGCRSAERRTLPGTADPRWCPGCNP